MGPLGIAALVVFSGVFCLFVYSWAREDFRRYVEKFNQEAAKHAVEKAEKLRATAPIAKSPPTFMSGRLPGERLKTVYDEANPFDNYIESSSLTDLLDEDI